MDTGSSHELDRLHAHLSAFYPRDVIKPGLERVRALCAAAGHPEDAFPAVHVAGSNGKGSVALLAARALSAAGLRTGLYTSPHLTRWSERIQIDEAEIPLGTFIEWVERLKPAAQAVDATVFELVTAVALAHFARARVDAAVVEVGLGGRYDATNVVRPLATAITALSLEHTDLLGDTLAQIAKEKAGIVKRGAPLVSAPLPEEAQRVVAEVCRARGVRQRVAEPLRRLDFSWDGQRFETDWGPITLRMLGGYQAQNLSTALALLESLERRFNLDRAQLRAGLESAVWPGRFEPVRRAPRFVLDGAHNPNGAERLLETLHEYEPLLHAGARKHLLFGIRDDKDYTAVAQTLFPWFDAVVLTKAAALRALDPVALLPYARSIDAGALAFQDAGDALAHALAASAEDDLVCATGSLYLVGELRERLRALAPEPEKGHP